VKGLYVLVMRLREEQVIRVGKLGVFGFPPGCYLYVGSAHGPGGLRARIERHRKRAGKPADRYHWHIDYLLPFVSLEEAWTLPGLKDECALARRLASVPGAQRVVPGFGASDCGCEGHLIRAGSTGGEGLRRLAKEEFAHECRPSCYVDCEPLSRHEGCAPGSTLMEVARKAGVAILSSCGGFLPSPSLRFLGDGNEYTCISLNW